LKVVKNLIVLAKLYFSDFLPVKVQVVCEFVFCNFFNRAALLLFRLIFERLLTFDLLALRLPF
jgi:hypothetical protein